MLSEELSMFTLFFFVIDILTQFVRFAVTWVTGKSVQCTCVCIFIYQDLFPFLLNSITDRRDTRGDKSDRRERFDVVIHSIFGTPNCDNHD